jgi:hypothetical protein
MTRVQNAVDPRRELPDRFAMVFGPVLRQEMIVERRRSALIRDLLCSTSGCASVKLSIFLCKAIARVTPAL